MRLATWNVNSIRARAARILGWVERTLPDVLCMQEIKVEDHGFPGDPYRALGYEIATHGQKTYNGVAILSRRPMTDVTRGFADGGDDAQARFMSARIEGLRVASVYVPNGQAPGSEKYAYKLAWLARLRAWIDARLAAGEPAILGGDYNVAPSDRDVHFPERWAGKIHASAPEREAFAALLAAGLVDVVRRLRPDEELLTWWDYRMLAFPKNDGLRIDHLLATPEVAERVTAVEIHRDERKGSQPSDHVPVLAELR
jgi:exodeoxyribonuclease III